VQFNTTLKVLSFADDTTVSCFAPNIHTLYNTINSELKALSRWFYANKLCLNAMKTKYILFRPSMTFPYITGKHVFIDNNTTSRVGDREHEISFKFLGIYIDETLSWKY
jgi:hypothetical protein